MTAEPLTDQQFTDRAEILNVLSVAGAYCGECGFEPGAAGCSDCVRVRGMYADAVMPLVQRLRAELAQAKRDHLAAIDQRDYAQSLADKLAKPRACGCWPAYEHSEHCPIYVASVNAELED